MPLPFSRLQCHSRRGGDLCFVDSPVVLATVGLSQKAGQSSLCLWDTLLPPSRALIAACSAHAEGGRCVVHSPADQSLVSGGDKGELVVFDLRQHRIREQWRAHNSPVQALIQMDGKGCFSADSDGDLKLWNTTSLHVTTNSNEECVAIPLAHRPCAHEPHSLLAPLVGSRAGRTGINSLQPTSYPAIGLLTGGGDGRVKYWPVGLV